MARTLLARGRPDDVVRMIRPLTNLHPKDASDATLHALLARVELLVHADPDRARSHLEHAFDVRTDETEAVAERHLWRGWLHAWPHVSTFRPALALADLQHAHRTATATHDFPTASWSLLGGAFLYTWLREPALALHLIRAVGDAGWPSHDLDLQIWYHGIAAALAVGQQHHASAELHAGRVAAAVERNDVPLYRGYAAVLQARIAVDQRHNVDEVRDLMATAQRMLADGARSYTPASAELELCRIDLSLRDGGHDRELEPGAEAAQIVTVPSRLARRKQMFQNSSEEHAAAARPHIDVCGDRLSFTLPFWGMLPPLSAGAQPLLIVGERGTGKKYLAERIHACTAAGPFVLFDCAAPVPGGVDLFGKDGDGLIADAAGGTLFLRDIDQLPLDSQRRLARLLRDRLVSCRITASSTSDATELRDSTEFSEQLFEQIARVVITLPPLRSRKAHIPVLASNLIEKLRPQELTLASITRDAMQALVAYSWPGNIRQLQNELERAITIVSSEPAPVIHVHDLSDEILNTVPAQVNTNGFHQESLDAVVAEAERLHIERVLAKNGGQVSASAEELGLSRQGLYKKMKRLKIDVGRFHSEDAPSTSR